MLEIETPKDGGTAVEARSPVDESPFFNRELSWLEFNARVLAEAEDPSVPLLERLKFVAIFGGNLDEFFMKRVGGLKLQLASRSQNALAGRPHAGRSSWPRSAPGCASAQPRQRAPAARRDSAGARQAGRRAARLPRPHGERSAAYLERFFTTTVFPILTPLGLDTSHPFPFISNLSLSLAVALRSAGERRGALRAPQGAAERCRAGSSSRTRCASCRSRVVIAEHLDRLFPGMELLESYPFRVTRAADVAKHEEPAEDLLESVQEELRARRFARVVRLEVVPEMPEWMRSLLADELAVGPEDVYEVRPPLAARDLFQLVNLPLPALQEPKWRPVGPSAPRARRRDGRARMPTSSR